MRRRRVTPLWTILALVLAATYLVPMLYVVIVSLTPTDTPLGWIPQGLAPSNYPQALGSAPFGVYLINSLVVAVVAMVAQIALSCAAGYALAKLPLPGRGALTALLVALLVVPAEIVMVPLFVMVTHLPLAGGNSITGQGGLGLIDTVGGLIVPHLVSALAIFLMRQFYAGLPDELGDSARVDGASEFRVFATIYTPLVMPAVAVVAVFAFQSAWNDFLWPLVMTRSPERQTLQLGLTVFFQENTTAWNWLMAAVLVISVPVVAIFTWVQRYFQSGALSGALK